VPAVLVGIPPQATSLQPWGNPHSCEYQIDFVKICDWCLLIWEQFGKWTRRRLLSQRLGSAHFLFLATLLNGCWNCLEQHQRQACRLCQIYASRRMEPRGSSAIGTCLASWRRALQPITKFP